MFLLYVGNQRARRWESCPKPASQPIGALPAPTVQVNQGPTGARGPPTAALIIP